MKELDLYDIDTDTEGYNLTFKCPSSFAVIGSTQAGKTTWILNVLRYSKLLFRQPKCAQNVIYFYAIWQDKFDEAEREGLVSKWVPEIPTQELVTEYTEKFKNDGGSIVIIDDHTNNLDKNAIQIFTVLTHHLRCCTFLLSQSLFPKCPAYREISLNCTYTVIFKTARDFRQFRTFAQQLFPRNWMFLVNVYEKETRKQFSYILVDHDHATPPLLQIRSNLLPHEGPLTIYKMKKKN